MDNDIKLNKSLKKLKKMASSYSFGRILGLISYIENTSVSDLLGQKFKAPNERLTNNEIAFLGALWLENYKNNNGFLWKKEDDIQKLRDVYRYLDLYHKSLKSKKYGESISEVAVYEGDGGYDWDFTKLATLKYGCVKSELKEHFNVDLYIVPSLYEKLKYQIQKKLSTSADMIFGQNLIDDEKTFKFYQISKDELESIFSAEEISVVKMLVSKLGFYKGEEIKDIFDFNEFNARPIIELPNGNLLIINLYTLAKAIYESPFYWICGLPKNIHHELLVRLGKGSENAAINILQKLGFSPISDILINRSYTEKETDIDILILHDKDAVVFQVKSQKLTMGARHGVEKTIDENFKLAVIKAYKQGISSVEALRNKDQHKELQNIKGLENIDKYHIICLTSDYYPTITPECLLHQDEVASNEFPLVGMTLLDLQDICNLLDVDAFMKYVNFRERCAVMRVYGDNEMYYLGKFIEQLLVGEKRPLIYHQKLPNYYAMLVDSILISSHNIGVNADALNYFINHSMYIKNGNKYINQQTRVGSDVKNILDHLSKESIMLYEPFIKNN